MNNTSKVLLVLGVSAIGVYLISKKAEAAPPEPPENGFIFSLLNTPVGSAKWVANLGAASFNFSPSGASPTLAIGDYWVYEGLYNGSPTWSLNCYVTVTIADADNNLVLQKSRTMLIENGHSYEFDCAI